METVVRNIRDLPQADRSALERMVGHPLSESAQVVVNVVQSNSEEPPATDSTGLDVPPCWKIYEGLSDDEIDRLDEAIRVRADLTRAFE